MIFLVLIKMPRKRSRSKRSRSKRSRSKRSRSKRRSIKKNKDGIRYQGKVALCFLVTKNLKNQAVWEKWMSGYEDYINIYTHVSGPEMRNKKFWDPLMWDNRIEKSGVKATKTKWGTTSLIVAEGLLYKAALKNKSNKYMCVISESGIPLWEFPEFYNRLFRYPNKSYLQTETMRGGDEDLFLDCFPESLIPTSKRPIPKTSKQRDMRYWLWKHTHQWKILNRWGARQFVNMIENKRWMDAYTNCFYQLGKDDPRLAADEVAYPNWIIYKFGPKAIDKHFRNYESTFVDFAKAGIHAKSYRNITKKMKEDMCLDKPFFARKFEHNPKLINQIPVRCAFGVAKTKNTFVEFY